MTGRPKPSRRRAVMTWLRQPVDLPWRRLLTLSIAFGALGCVVVGIAMIYLPAGVIATGLALFAALTFDPSAARKVTWPR